jgi:hypothetical protein
VTRSQVRSLARTPVEDAQLRLRPGGPAAREAGTWTVSRDACSQGTSQSFIATKFCRGSVQRSMAASPPLAPVDQCSSILFDERTGLFNDSCFQRDRDRQSTESSNYGVLNHRNLDVCGRDVLALSTCHPNLRFKNGVGNVSSCNVETDSSVRIEGPKTTNPKHRQQLATRVAHAGPNLSRGDVNADAESALIHAENSLRKRPCSVLTGVTTDNFAPLLPCVQSVQAVEHVVPNWQVVDTRAWVRDADYLKRCKLER